MAYYSRTTFGVELKQNNMKQTETEITVKHPYATALKWLDAGLKDLRKTERHVKITTVEIDNEENIEAFKLIREQRTELMRAKQILEKHLEL